MEPQRDSKENSMVDTKNLSFITESFVQNTDQVPSFSDEENFISVKRDSRKYGYTSDHLGYLCRSGKIKGKKIGREWFAEEKSIFEFIFEGKNLKPLKDIKNSYGYTSDHLASLCRSKKIKGKRVNDIWYVDEGSLLEFIKETEESKKNQNQKKAELLKSAQNQTKPNNKSFNISFKIPTSFANSLLVTSLLFFAISFVATSEFKAEKNNFNSNNFSAGILSNIGQGLSLNLKNASRKIYCSVNNFLELKSDCENSYVLKDLNDAESKKEYQVIPQTNQPQRIVEKIIETPKNNIEQIIIEGPIQIFENIKERIITQNGIDENALKSAIEKATNKLTDDINQKLNNLSTGNNTVIQNIYNQIAGTNNIDRLQDVSLITPSISGGVITNSSFSGTTGTFSNTLSAGSITTSGSLGVGTSSPFTTFAVSGNSYFDGTLTATGLITGTFNGTGTSTFSGIGVQNFLAGGYIETPYIRATSTTATSTLSGNLSVGGANGIYITGNGAGLRFSGTGNHDIEVESGTLRIGSNTIMGNIEALNNTIDIGTPGTRFDKIYADEVNASSIVGTIVGGNVSAETLNINSDNATADTEDSYLAFERGSLSPNALLQWNSSQDLFDLNQPLFIQNDNSTTTIITLDLKGTAGQTANLFRVASSSSDSFFVINSNGNIGISTSSPYAKLSVVGEIVGEKFTATSTTATSTFAGGFAVETSGLVYDHSTNNVGIGTASPGTKLYVSGGNISVDAGSYFQTNSSNNWRVGQASSGSALDFNGQNSGAISFAFNTSIGTLVTSAGNVGIGTTTPWAKLSVNPSALGSGVPEFAIGSSSATHFIVDGGGNVGIGITNPTYKFQVNVANPTNGIIAKFYNTTYPAGTGAQIQLTQDSVEDWTFGQPAAVSAFAVWEGRYSSAVGTERFRINAGGNVGIGTTSPYSKLSIQNLATDSTAPLFTIASSTATATTTLLTVLNSGNVGVGTASPSYKLDVNGTIGNSNGAVSLNAGGTNQNITLTPSGTGDVVVSVNASAGDGFQIDFNESQSGGRKHFFFNGGTGASPQPMKFGGLDKIGYGGMIVFNSANVAGEIGFRNGYDQGMASLSMTTFGLPSTLKMGGSVQGWSGYTDQYVQLTASEAGVFAQQNGTNPQKFQVFNTYTNASNYERGTVGWSSNIFNIGTENSGTGSARSLSLITASTTRLTIDTSGNVGIGTTSPSTKLHVTSGTFLVNNNSDSTADTGLRLVSAIGTSKYNWMIGAQQNINNGFEITPSTSVNGTTFSTPALTVLQNGNVGIGTASPNTTLEVAGLGRFTGDRAFSVGSDTGQYRIQTDTDLLSFGFLTSGNSYAGIKARSLAIGASYGSIAPPSNGVIIEGNVGIGTTSPYAPLSVAGHGGVVANIFTATSTTATSTFAGGLAIETSGLVYDRSTNNVGIGTASPLQELHIKGSSQPLVRIESESQADSVGFSFYDSAGQTGQLLQFDRSHASASGILLLGTNQDGGSLLFRTGSNQNRMTIDSAGKVGIGDLSPDYQLELSGYGASQVIALSNSNISHGITAQAETDVGAVYGYSYTDGGAFIQGISDGDTFGVRIDAMVGSTDPTDSMEAINLNASKKAITNVQALGSLETVLAIKNNGTKLLTVLGDGNTGIGTTSPWKTLSLDGTSPTLWVKGTAQGSIVLEDSGATNDAQLVQLLSNDGYFRIRQVADSEAAVNEYLNLNLANGNFGIGTTTPGAQVGISGSAPKILFADTSNRMLAIEGPTGSNAGARIYTPSNHDLLLGTSNTDWVTISSLTGKVTLGNASTTQISTTGSAYFATTVGNVGIGTTTPNGKLDIGGTTLTYNHRLGVKLSNDADASTGLIVERAVNDTSLWLGYNTTADGFQISSSYGTTGSYKPITFYTSSSERLRLDTNGNIGIGTTSPYSKLSIQNLATDSTAPLFTIASSTATATTTLFTVLNSGNVGIGIASPLYRLHTYSNTANTSNILYIENGDNSSGTSDSVMQIVVGGNSAGDPKTIYSVPGQINYSIGIDNSDGNKFKINYNADLGTNNSITIDNSGNVGIGTSTPNSPLSVTGWTRFNSSPTANNPSSGKGIEVAYRTDSGNDYGLIQTYDRDASVFKSLRLEGSNIILNGLGGSGNVGIGTTSPDNLLTISPTLSGAINIRPLTEPSTVSATQRLQFSHQNGVALGYLQMGYDTDAGDLTRYTDLSLISTQANSKLIFGTNSIEQMRINEGGLVGIGTTSPWAKLSVHPSALGSSVPEFAIGSSSATHFIVDGGGNVGIGTASPTGNLHIRNTGTLSYSATSYQDQHALILQQNSSTNYFSNIRFQNGSNLENFIGVVQDSNGAGDFFFKAHQGSGVYNELLRIKSNGNVGIGTTAPNFTSGSGLEIQVAGTATLRLDNSSDSRAFEIQATGSSVDFLGANGSQPFRFKVGAIERAVFAADGNVGIGTTSPYSKLSIHANNGETNTTLFNIASSTATATTTLFTVLNSGNVGIGITNPNAKLVVNGTNAAIDIAEAGTSLFRAELGANASYLSTIGANNLFLRTNQVTALTINGTNQNVTIAQNLTVSGTGNSTFSGNVGVGSTTPWAKLSVNPSALGVGVPEFAIGSSSATHLIVDGGGNVGIGTASPSYKLTVSGVSDGIAIMPSDSPYGTRTIIVGGGPSGLGATSDVMTEFNGVFNTNDSSLVTDFTGYAFRTSGSEKMRLTPSGNLGIGTTSPYSKLSIHANNGETNSALFTIASSTATATSTHFIVTNIGSVGIGTASPGAALEISTSTNASSVAPTIRIRGHGSIAAGGGNSIEFMGSNSVLTKIASIHNGASRTDLVFYGQNGSLQTTARINGDGNMVLLGTLTSPGAPDIAENIKVSDPSIEAGDIVVADQNYTSTSTDIYNKASVKKSDGFGNVLGIISTNPGIMLNSPKDAVNTGERSSLEERPLTLAGRVPVKFSNENGEVIVGDRLTASKTIPGYAMKMMESGQSIGIALEESNSNTTKVLTFVDLSYQVIFGEKFTIDSNGNIGVGTSSPQHKLHVAGDVAATGFINTSTKEAKKDIEYLTEEEKEGFLDKIKNLGVATYRYNQEEYDSKLRLGLIAEEAPTEVLSEDNKGVDIYKLATFTLAGVQELIKKIENIDERLKVLEELGGAVVSSAGSMIDQLASLGVTFTNGITKIASLVVESVTIGSAEKPTGVTVYDKNGQAGCLEVEDVTTGSVNVRAGSCDNNQNNNSAGAVASDSEPPIITLNGNNPSYIDLNSSYVDLGALVTDNVDQNLGITAYVNGVEVGSLGNILLDTSIAGEHIISYKSVDNAGNSITVMRAVVVGGEPFYPTENLAENNDSNFTATSTESEIASSPINQVESQ
jgi:hypothetical protein